MKSRTFVYSRRSKGPSPTKLAYVFLERMSDYELTKPVLRVQLDKASDEGDACCQVPAVEGDSPAELDGAKNRAEERRHRLAMSPKALEDKSSTVLHRLSPTRSGHANATSVKNARVTAGQDKRPEPTCFLQGSTTCSSKSSGSSGDVSGSESPKELFDKCQWIIENRLGNERLKKMDDDFWNSRAELMNTYASIINADLQFALHNRVVHKMWKHGVKAVIDQYHRLLNGGIELAADMQRGQLFPKNPILERPRSNSDVNHQSLSDKHRIIRVNYTHFLEETRGFYLRLLMTVTLRSGRICGLTDGLQISGHLVLDSLVSSPLKRLFFHAPGAAPESAQQKANTARQQRALQAIIHSLLVQMGDLARYLHHFSDAERCYEQAARVAPSLGQPYNQLAILFEGIRTNDSRDSVHNDYDKGLSEGERMLSVTFYYVRALAVPVSFTLAAQNLKRITKGHTFLQFAGRTENILTAGDNSAVCTGTDQLLNLFLYIFAQIYDAIGFLVDKDDTGKRMEQPVRPSIDKRESADPGTPLECKLAAAIHKFRASIVPVLTQHSLSSQCLVQIAALSIFLHHNSIKGNLKQPDSSSAGQCSKILPFAVALLAAILDQLIEVAAMPFSSELTINRFHVLPAAYILLLYVLNIDERQLEKDSTEQKPSHAPKSSRQFVEMSPVFWLNLGRLLSSFNVLDKELGKGSFFERYTGYCLAEERYLQCFLPLDGMLGCAVKRNSDTSGRNFQNLPGKDEGDAANSFHSDFLCEKDELQLRKIRMVCILQRYLAHSKQSLDEGETCPVKCLRNTVPLKIVLLPVANKSLSTDKSENCSKTISLVAPRQLCFQSDLSLLQKMQAIQETKQECIAGKHEAKRKQWGAGRHLQQPRKAKHTHVDGSAAGPTVGYPLSSNAAGVGCEQVAHAHPQFIQQQNQASSFAAPFGHSNPVAMATMFSAMHHFLQGKQAMTSSNASDNPAAVGGCNGAGNILCQPMWYQLNGGRPNSMMPMESRCGAVQSATSTPMLASFPLTQPMPSYDQWPAGKSPSLPGALAQKFNNLSVAGHLLQAGDAAQRVAGQTIHEAHVDDRHNEEPTDTVFGQSTVLQVTDKHVDGSSTAADSSDKRSKGR